MRTYVSSFTTDWPFDRDESAIFVILGERMSRTIVREAELAPMLPRLSIPRTRQA